MGISTDREPSPSELADLTRQIEELGVTTIFTETTVNDRVAQAVAAETGAQVVQLYTESLGEPGSGVETYISMMEENARRIAEALG